MHNTQAKKYIILTLSLIALFFQPMLQIKNQAATGIFSADIDSLFSFSLKNGFYQGDIDVAISPTPPHNI